MNNQLRATMAALAILVTTSTLNAAQIPLSTSAPFTTLEQLLPAEDFAVFEDLRFDNFDYAWTGEMPSPAGVNVIPVYDGDGNPGLRFQGGFVDDAGGDASDALITFTVTAMGPWIADAHLGGNPDLFSGEPGTGLASVTETFAPEITDDSITVYDNGSVEQLADAIIFDSPRPYLNVQKDILLMSAENGAGAGLSFIDQTFSLVPEPSTMALFGLAFVGMLSVRRRR